MSVTAEAASRSVTAQVAGRWQLIDPLLPLPEGAAGSEPQAGADHVILAEDDGRLVALGTCEHWAGSPDSLDLTWGAARRFQLGVQIAGPDVGASLDRLLSAWREHLDNMPGADDADSAAVVTWPSRDVDGIGTLLHRGFAPRGVVAARLAGRRSATRSAGSPDDASCGPVSPAEPQSGIQIRRAVADDIDAVVRLGLETIRFDAHFGGVIERPSTPAALRQEISGMLAEPRAWTWLAERSGTAIGMLTADGPESAGWIAPMVRLAPVAYNMLTFVSPDERGSGVGAALVTHFHADAEAAGVPVTLLHYEQTNPLAAPFWGQQGYRPVWTSWEARPADTIR